MLFLNINCELILIDFRLSFQNEHLDKYLNSKAITNVSKADDPTFASVRNLGHSRVTLSSMK